MNYLLDTHTFIWFSENDLTLPDSLKSIIENSDNTIFLSMISLWEIAIKNSLGKLPLTQPLEIIIKEVIDSRLHLLNISPSHILQVNKLPYHHRDPFDRLIIAQGVAEQLTIITKDIAFNKYSVSTQW